MLKKGKEKKRKGELYLLNRGGIIIICQTQNEGALRCVAQLLAVSGDTMSEESERETNPPPPPPCPTVSQREQWMVESQVFQIYQLFATILLFSGWSFNAIITCSMSPKAFAISVPHFPFWTLSESLSLSLSLSLTHTHTLCFCCLNRSQFSVIVFFFGLN